MTCNKQGTKQAGAIGCNYVCNHRKCLKPKKYQGNGTETGRSDRIHTVDEQNFCTNFWMVETFNPINNWTNIGDCRIWSINRHQIFCALHPSESPLCSWDVPSHAKWPERTIESRNLTEFQ